MSGTCSRQICPTPADVRYDYNATTGREYRRTFDSPLGLGERGEELIVALLLPLRQPLHGELPRRLLLAQLLGQVAPLVLQPRLRGRPLLVPRAARGVRIFRLAKDGRVVSVAHLGASANGDDEASGEADEEAPSEADGEGEEDTQE